MVCKTFHYREYQKVALFIPETGKVIEQAYYKFEELDENFDPIVSQHNRNKLTPVGNSTK